MNNQLIYQDGTQLILTRRIKNQEGVLLQLTGPGEELAILIPPAKVREICYFLWPDQPENTRSSNNITDFLAGYKALRQISPLELRNAQMIIDMVLTYFNISMENLRCRRHKFTYQRIITIHLLRAHTNISTAVIGRLLQRSPHTVNNYNHSILPNEYQQAYYQLCELIAGKADESNAGKN